MGNLFGRCVGTTEARVASAALPPNATPSPAPQQPLTAAADWLLTQDEITASRGGAVRSELSLFSTGDRVTPYASSDAYFRQLLDDLTAADVTSVWIAGWSLNHTVPLDPTTSNDVTSTSLRSVLERAVRDRGVHVRALVWANLFQRTECLATRDWMNALGASLSASGQGSALMLFDNRLPHPVSSHHQKCVVIQRTHGTTIAFMGGLDISTDRWDTLTHDQRSVRDASGWTAAYAGWIDASVRLEGRAAQDVAATFATRWNASVKPANCWKEDLLDFENPEAYQPVLMPAPPDSFLSTASPESTVSVQIVRTFSPHRADTTYPSLAPRGELSVLHARIKAIGCAKNWIFIEDQYFFVMPQLLTALRTALETQRTLRVVVMVQNPTLSTQSKVAGYEKLVFEMARPLLDAYATRIQIYTTKPTRNLYGHTKLLIVDDVFLSISSANWNRRSMTSDTELGANLVDASLVDTPDAVRVGKMVRAFQLTKLQELTGRPTDALRRLTIAQRCDLIAQAASESATIVAPLEVEKKWAFAVFQDEFTLHVVDPDDVNHASPHGESGNDGDNARY